MRIISRLKTISTVMLAALVVLAPVLIWSFWELKNAKDDYALADAIRVNYFERASYMDQYFLYREIRERQQWDKSNTDAAQLLSLADTRFDDAADRQILERLRKNIADSDAIFQRIVDNTEALMSATGNRDVYAELDKRLFSQLLLRSAVVRDMASALKDSNTRRVELAYKQLALIFGLFAILLAGVALLTALHLARLIRKRLSLLHDGAKVIADGNLAYRIEAGGGDEFAELAQSVNAMTDKLAAEIGTHTRLENALRDSEEKLQAILSAAEVAIAWANEDGVIEYVNPKFVTLFGYTLNDVPNIEQWYLHAYPDAAYREKAVAEWNAKVARSLPHRGAIESMEVTVSCKDGSVRHMLLMGSWAGTRLLANFSDITERIKAEQVMRELNADLDATLLAIPDLLFELDQDGRYFNVWAHDPQLLAAQKEVLLGRTVNEMLPPDAAKTVMSALREAAEKKYSHRQIIRLSLPHGDSWFELSTSLKSTPDNATKRFIMLSRDITERKIAEERLLSSEARLRAILDNVPYLIWLKDMEGRFVAVNKQFFNSTGKTGVEEVLGKTDLELWPKEMADKYRADDAEVIAMRKQKLTEEMSLDNGEVRWVETFKAPVIDVNGHLIGTTGFAQDITARKNAEVKIRRLAHYDTLTDLPNRTLFSDRLQQALHIAKRDQTHMALMFIDLDKFKPINDELGHHVGDLLLKEAAKRMHDCMRESDTIARIGGDEFVVLLPVIEAVEDAMLVAEKIREELNRPFVLVGKSLNISSSTGIAVYPEHGKDETQLMKNADVAMYHAKEGGRNKVMLYQPKWGTNSPQVAK